MPTASAPPGSPSGKPPIDLTRPPEDGSDGLLQPFNVKDEYGVPISAYTVKADTGGWKDIDLKIWNIVAQVFFSIAKWSIGFACWLIDWALGFGLAKIMVVPAEQIANTVREVLFHRLGLPATFMTIAGVYAGYLIMFKERSRGYAEAGMSLVVAALAVTVFASPAQVLMGNPPKREGSTEKVLPDPTVDGRPTSTLLMSDDGVLGKARDLSLQLADLMLSNDPSHSEARPEAVSKRITDPIVRAFIVQPNQLMLYGRVFEGECAEAFGKAKLVFYNYEHTGLSFWEGMLSGNPSEDRTYYEQLVAATDKFRKICGTKGDPKAKRASADLAFSALFVAVAAVIVAILMVLVTGGFLSAQGWIAFESIRGHWALCAGILPGGGRGVLWRWVSAIVKAILSVFFAIIFLAIFILIVLALLKAETGPVLAKKFMAVDIAAIAALAGHKKIKENAQRVATNLNRKLANARVGGSRSSVFNNYRYGETAPGLKQLWGEARDEAGKVSRPLGRAGRTARQLWVGSPQGGSKGGRMRSAAKRVAGAAAVVGTGGAAAAARVAAQGAARQTLKNRLSNRMSRTRGGRVTMATGKAVGVAGKYGWKASKFAGLALGAPLGMPNGVAATRRGARAATARAQQVKSTLIAAGGRASQTWDGAKTFGSEWAHNVGVAGRFAARQAVNVGRGAIAVGNGANIQARLAQPLTPPSPGPTTAAVARLAQAQPPAAAPPGSPPAPGGSPPTPPPSSPPPPPAVSPASPANIHGAQPPRGPQAPGTGATRRVRRATRPQGPPNSPGTRPPGP
ncbi:hypothetical protein [Embleya sp. MST-111070]|uniref:hypothetical protein n=1 Tax=Embleya sp. MST-111070 TaxID=3398231 RepID=UPI003F7391AC